MHLKSFLSILLAAFLLSAASARAEEDARLSAALFPLYGGPAVSEWLATLPGESYIDAYVLVPAQTGEDVVFGLDQELDEGVTRPAYVTGGDWMGLIGLQRNGNVWVAKGTDETLKGNPSKDRDWGIIPLGAPLQPGAWYHLRTVLDFHTRHYVSFTIQGPGIDRMLDLKALSLDYPNYLPFDDHMLTNYVFAMRVKRLMKDPGSGAQVYFDRISAGSLSPDGKDVPWRQDAANSLASDGKLATLPIPFLAWFGASIPLASLPETTWYLEQKAALVRAVPMPGANGSRRMMLCDATLQSLDYGEWFERWDSLTAQPSH